MARPTKPPVPPVPPARKRGPLPVILAVAVVVAGGVFFYLHSTEKQETEPQAAPVAAVQPEVTTPRAIAKNHIYSTTADPKAEIAAALVQAKREHKRVIVDFGGDWCGDCQVLDYYFRQAPNSDLLSRNFILTHVYVGEEGAMNQHLDIAKKYEIPVNKGVPALAVLDADGKLLYSQQSGEFESMRKMDPSSVSDFLGRWKA